MEPLTRRERRKAAAITLAYLLGMPAFVLGFGWAVIGHRQATWQVLNVGGAITVAVLFVGLVGFLVWELIRP